eukprot:40478-Amphidinium_carterae.1
MAVHPHFTGVWMTSRRPSFDDAQEAAHKDDTQESANSDEEKTSSYHVAEGSHRYMSPQRLRSMPHSCTPAADIYALAMVMMTTDKLQTEENKAPKGIVHKRFFPKTEFLKGSKMLLKTQ